LIELYTYEGDVVLDPFMGSGSTAVAAVRTRRHYIGFDTDPAYCATARQRIAASRPAPAAPEGGRMAKEISRNLVETCGFTDLRTDVNVRGLGITLDLVARDRAGTDWAFGVCGGFSSSRSGLRRSDTLWRAIGGAAVLHASESAMPLVLLATEVPALRTAGHMALSAVLGPGRPVVDVIELLDPDGRERLGRWAANGPPLRFVSEKSPSR
jgi:site-specific DNA-methyltransferase (adenine-specific)